MKAGIVLAAATVAAMTLFVSWSAAMPASGAPDGLKGATVGCSCNATDKDKIFCPSTPGYTCVIRNWVCVGTGQRICKKAASTCAGKLGCNDPDNTEECLTP